MIVAAPRYPMRHRIKTRIWVTELSQSLSMNTSTDTTERDSVRATRRDGRDWWHN